MNPKIKEKKTHGITLIALAITILIILLLAGITMSTLFGKNGIINYADRAKEEAQRSKYQDVLDTLQADMQAKKIQENFT